MAHILIIDDDDTFRDTLGLLLTEAGHTIDSAPDGHEGLKRLREKPAQLVITDIVMPKQEGLETISTMRREFPQTGIIAMSGGVPRSKNYLEIARRLGAHRTIAKPFLPQELHAVIAGLLAQLPPADQV